MIGIRVRLGGGQEQANGWAKRCQDPGIAIDLKYLRPEEEITPEKTRDRVGNEIRASRSIVPVGGISGRLHRGRACVTNVVGLPHIVGQVQEGFLWTRIGWRVKPEGSEAISTYPLPVGFPIKTACQMYLGVLTQNALSGETVQQSREGTNPLLPVSFALHCGPLQGSKPCGKWSWLYTFPHCGSI